MKSLFNHDRAQLSHRLDGLTSDRKPQWGKMDCGQMLAHVSDAVRMALGELFIKPRRSPLRLAPFRHAIIYWLPFPKGAPTAPELIQRRAEDCRREIAELRELLERFATRAGAEQWSAHPLFGQLSERDWGVLSYKHIDHHLRQFGV